MSSSLCPLSLPLLINDSSFLQRRELQQQMNLDALLAASGGSSGMQQSLRGNATDLIPEAVALGLGSPNRRGAASLVRPPRPNLDGLNFGGRNPAASLMGASSLQQGIPEGYSMLNDIDRESMGANPVLFRALMNRRLQEEDSAALAVAGLGAAAAGNLNGAVGLLGRMNPSLVSRPAESMGSPVQMSGDSIRQAMMREQTIAQAAAANSMANRDGTAAQRLKRSRLS